MIKFLLSFLLLLSQAKAETFNIGNTRLDVNGYVGYKHISSTIKNTTFNDTPELGLALSYQMTDNFSAYTQFAYSEHDIDNALVYSFLSYDLPVNEDLTIGVKGGKLRFDYGLYNSTRINPRTRQGVISPQSIYWDSLLYIITSGVGVNFNIKFKSLELSYTIDQPQVVDPKTEAKTWASGLLNSIESSFGSHSILSAKYKFDQVPLLLKGSWTNINLGDNNSAIYNYVFPNRIGQPQKVQLLTGGFEYEIGKYTVSAEALLVKPFFAEFDYKNSYGTSYTIKREITENVDLRFNYNHYFTSTTGLSGLSRTTDDLNVGLSYHQDKWMIQGEVHHINGGRWTNPNDWSQGSAAYKEWYMIGLNAVYFF